jgi:fructosamine-3-kinase
MTRQPLVARHAEELLGSAVVATAPISGGDVCVATKLRLSDGTTAVMKTLNNAPAGFFASEAAGLRWLAEAGGAGVPEVLASDGGCLILRWVEPGRPSADAASAFGRALAVTHRAGAPALGGEADGFIARLPLLNNPAPTWAEFFAQRRLLPYLRLAADRDRITADDVQRVESVMARLADLVPQEPPARLHGDLWNGNVLWGTEQRVWMIDPAAHGGHRETDLAMLALFGLPHLPRVLDAYHEVSPLADGWQDRAGIHQLFPLLVHACLFGGGYGARAGAAAARYL